jgi:DNA-binding response OmpR family regulator
MPDGGHAHICPACGGLTTKAAPVAVDLNSNMAVIGSKHIPLAPKEAELLHTVIEVFPGYASMDRIMSRVYGAGEWPNHHIVFVMVANIRRKLAPYKVAIKNRTRGRGERGGYRVFRMPAKRELPA